MADFDVLISGGGMAGASLAVALARQGRSVCVIEPIARDADHQPSYDDRTLVLNAASLNILGNLGLLNDGPLLTSIREIHVSRRGALGHLQLHARDHGRPRFGAVILARELGNCLLAALASHAGIETRCPDALESFETGPEAITAHLASGDRVTGRLLVGADGTRSGVREQAGLPSQTHDYEQSALVFNARPGQAHNHRAFERFTRSGPVAVLPQPQGRVGVVMIDQTQVIRDLSQAADATLITELQHRFGHRLGGFSLPGQRAFYPLQRLSTPDSIAERTVLIGNAATTVHPVSAQGFNLGLRDVACLSDCLLDASDPGAATVLQGFEDLRRTDRAETLRYTDTLARSFTNPSLPFRLGTRVGLVAHSLIPLLQRRLVTTAMGFRSPVSRLAAAEWQPTGGLAE